MRLIYISAVLLVLVSAVVAQPVGQVSPTNLAFGSVLVGTTSPQLQVILKNTGNATMTVPSVSTSAPFAVAVNKCQKVIKAGANCKVWVTYAPQAPESDTGTLDFSDNASNSPQTVSLAGSGINLKTLYWFPSNGKDGAWPNSLASDSKGNLYGAAAEFGSSRRGDYGTLFKLSSKNKLAVLHRFSGSPDGAYPYLASVVDAEGNFYGTTEAGGNSTNCDIGCGTIFKITPEGDETVLHSFTASPNDGAGPTPGLVFDSQGNLYGTTTGGGNSTNCPYGCGTVFKLSPNGQETVLYNFTGYPNDGSSPSAGLVIDGQGSLYGTTYGGGPTANCSDGYTLGGCGTVFKITPNGTETVLYSFIGGEDGAAPSAGLVWDSQGNLYGTTYQGGNSACSSGFGCGTVFEVSANGEETVMYRFSGYPNDGSGPTAGLTLDAGGNLYGTAQYGSSGCPNGYGCGTVFKLDPSGNETLLYSFTGGQDGAYPSSNLLFDAHGALIGTTLEGGQPNMHAVCVSGCGVVFAVATK